MSKFPSLKNHLLIAMPSLKDANFSRSVTLLCEHNADGAMGLVINHPLDFSTSDLLEHMEIPCSHNHNINPVFAGGPVQVDRGFVIHRADKLWKSSISLENNISVTTSSDILHAIGRHEVDDDAIIALGYAGWEAGQLEYEIMENSWLTVPLNPEIIFSTDIDKRWEKAAELLGVDITTLTHTSGHA
ncbi:YqgE/AlgH family protein [Aliikangiella sp. G2MR2-5]|uniref:YqgE/AlgH family protein n=1 Tax=Aliikangiella sp. G2MR2-5 TaxID=2788943 RepID=UPI0018A99141|nr:YqgE/AlgH family protein [Aliikangiella sp. G2MR2-5]